MKARRLAARLLLLAGITALAVWAAFHRDRLDPAALDAWLSGLGVWAPVAYVALYAVGTVLFVPGAVFAVVGGVAFGPWWGAILNLVGATIGAGLAFLIARYLAADWAARKAGGGLRRLMQGVEAEGWRSVALVRLVPLFPFNLTNYALGLTRIGLLPYLAASFICMAPGAVAYTWLGHAGRSAWAGDGDAVRYGLLALATLATLAFLPRLLRRLRRDGASDWIEPEEVHRQIATSKAPTVLDVRGADEFSGPLGHVRGALNLPLGELDRRLDEVRAAATHRIVIVCRTDKRSAMAQATLRAAGIDDTAVLRGGMERWNALGFETVRDNAAGRLATAEEVPS